MRIIFTLILTVFIVGCSNRPVLDSVIPTDSSEISKPTQDSHVGISMGLDLTELNNNIQQYVGTSMEHRTGVSVKVHLHDVIINTVEEATIKTWHESKVAWSKARRDTGIRACNVRYPHSRSKRRDCRNKRYNNHDNRMSDYNATKARRMANNRKKEVSAFEIKPSSGKDNYVIASARLDKIDVSSKSDKLVVFTQIHAKIKLNVENPFDHSKEIKGLVNTSFDIKAALAANISFTQDGKIKLVNKEITFSPRFNMPSKLKPLKKLADKMNDKISEKIKEQVDKQIAKVEFKKNVDEKLSLFTSEINSKLSKKNIWIIPNISKIMFNTNKDFSSDRNMIGINLGLILKPEVIYSKVKPSVIDKIDYDVTFTNENSPNNISLNSSALISLSDISPILTTKIQEEINFWVKSNEEGKALKKKLFDIEKVELLTSKKSLLIVLYTTRPVRGTIILSTTPIIKKSGQMLEFTEVSLYTGTRSVLSKETSWLLKFPLDSILKDKLSIDLKSYFDKNILKIKKEGIPVSKKEKLIFKDANISLKRLNASNGNLLIESSLKSNIEVIPKDN